MLCEECGQREAEVLMTAVVNGESVTRQLCRECFQKYKAGDIQSVLAAVLAAMNQSAKKPGLVCPRCGETYAEFQKSGKMGCAECYQAFRKSSAICPPQLFFPIITLFSLRSNRGNPFRKLRFSFRYDIID